MNKAFIQILTLNTVVVAAILLFSYMVYSDSLIDSCADLGVSLLMYGLYNLGLGTLLFIVSVGKKSVRPYVFSMIIVALALMVAGLIVTGITRHSR